MATLRQSLNTIELHVADVERWEKVAADLDEQARLGALDFGAATNAAHLARTLARAAEDKAVAAMHAAYFEHRHPREV